MATSLHLHGDAARLGVLGLRDAHAQHALRQLGRHGIRVELLAQREHPAVMLPRHLDMTGLQTLGQVQLHVGLDDQPIAIDAQMQLLARHAGADGALFGATVSGRSGELPGIEQTVGLFINTLPVRVRLANTDHRLRPNVYARIRFQVQHPEASLEIPAAAVVSDGERQYVYVQDKPGHFARREVVAGSAHEGRIPIIKGLSAGESIDEPTIRSGCDVGAEHVVDSTENVPTERFEVGPQGRRHDHHPVPVLPMPLTPSVEPRPAKRPCS